MVKEFFKNIGTGLLFFLLSASAMALGGFIYIGITAIPSCAGWEAIGLAVICIIMGVMAVAVITSMGVIPNETVDRLKRKIAELEDTEDDL